MTIAEYEAKFAQLSRFATFIVQIEVMKAQRLEQWLSPSVKDKLVPLLANPISS